MPDTPQAAKVLSDALAAHSWSQSDLAKASAIDRTQVNLHINGTRAIRDDHLALYCNALDRTEQSQLVAAWLRDTLPADAQEAVLSHDTNRLNEEVKLWKPCLDPDQQSMIQWWTERLALDRELDEVFRIVTRRAGWTPHEPS